MLAYQRYGRGKALVAARAGHLAVADARRRWPSRTRRTHTFWQRLIALAGGRRAGSRHGDARRPTACSSGEPVTLTAEVVDPEYQGHQRRPHHGARRRRRRARSRTCRWSGRSSTTASTARASRRPKTGSTGWRSAARRSDGKDVGARHDDRPRRAERRRVLRRRDARAAPAAHRRGDRRPVLPRGGHRASSWTRSPTAARASRSSKRRSCGTCRSSCILLLGLMGGEWLYRRSRGLA